MDKVKGEHADGDWHAVEPVEEGLVGDDGSIPSVVEFDGTIDTTGSHEYVSN
jgi:hypothetical protein